MLRSSSMYGDQNSHDGRNTVHRPTLSARTRNETKTITYQSGHAGRLYEYESRVELGLLHAFHALAVDI